MWKSYVLGFALLTLPAGANPIQLSNLWMVTIGSHGDSSPAVGGDGTILFGARDGKLWALNADGSVKWVFQTGLEIKSSPAVGSDGTVYIGSRDRCLYAVGADGAQKWRFHTGAWVDSSPALGRDGMVYFGSWDKNFYAVKANGSQEWVFPTEGHIVSSPAVGADGTIYFGSMDRKFYAVGPDGRKKWEYAAGGAIISSPALNRGQCVYFTALDGRCYAVDPDGKLLWRLRTGGITESSPVVAEDGTIYVGVNQELWAITAQGKQKWPRWNEEPIDAAPTALARRTVSFISRRGSLLTLDENREPVCAYFCYGGSCASPGVGPTGISYLFDRYFRFSAIGSDLPLAASPWPKFRGNARNTGNVADGAP